MIIISPLIHQNHNDREQLTLPVQLMVSDSYIITPYANNAQWTEQIFIRTWSGSFAAWEDSVIL